MLHRTGLLTEVQPSSMKHMIMDMMSDLVAYKHRKEFGHVWYQMSLLRSGIIKAMHKFTLLCPPENDNVQK